MNLANRISICRILLVPFFIACLLYYSPEKDFLRLLALYIFLIGVVTDAADGYIARNQFQKTRLGTFIDPLADKLMLVSAFVALSVLNNLPANLKIPPWVCLIVISRDVLILMGSSVIYIMNGNLVVHPSMLGKLTTFFQMVSIVCILLRLSYSFILWNTAVLFTIASGIGYLRRASQLLNNTNPALLE